MIGRVMRGATWRRLRVGRRLRIASVALLLATVGTAGALVVAATDTPNSLHGLEATYEVAATIQWGAKQLDVTSTATVSNNTDTAVGALTFNAAPARIGGMLLGSVTAGGETASASVS